MALDLFMYLYVTYTILLFVKHYVIVCHNTFCKILLSKIPNSDLIINQPKPNNGFEQDCEFIASNFRCSNKTHELCAL